MFFCKNQGAASRRENQKMPKISHLHVGFGPPSRPLRSPFPMPAAASLSLSLSPLAALSVSSVLPTQALSHTHTHTHTHTYSLPRLWKIAWRYASPGPQAPFQRFRAAPAAPHRALAFRVCWYARHMGRIAVQRPAAMSGGGASDAGVVGIFCPLCLGTACRHAHFG